ncbi:DDE superfamily endonuclease [Chromohalobacter israelensis]|nr:DDE superfamily endonuclease [Chromohalobacter salexigens]
MGHKPKAELARDMLVRALDSGVTAHWVTGDAVYGESFQLRWALEERGQGYVMAVSRKTHVWLGLKQRKVGYLLATLQANTEFGWARLSAGAGSLGCLTGRFWPSIRDRSTGGSAECWYVRRSLNGTQEMTAYLTFAPNGTSLEGLVLAAGARRNIERCFQEGKSQLGPCRSAIIYDYSSRLVSMIAGQDHSSRRGQSHCKEMSK